jgi:hypothetical protein
VIPSGGFGEVVETEDQDIETDRRHMDQSTQLEVLIS